MTLTIASKLCTRSLDGFEAAGLRCGLAGLAVEAREAAYAAKTIADLLVRDATFSDADADYEGLSANERHEFLNGVRLLADLAAYNLSKIEDAGEKLA